MAAPRKLIPEIPDTRGAQLSERELGLLRNICRAPALWLFQVAWAHLGLDAAVDACRDRIFPQAFAGTVTELGWSASANLPDHREIKAILLGVRIENIQRRVGSKEVVQPLRVIAQRCGASLDAAAEAMRTLRRLSVSLRETPQDVEEIAGMLRAHLLPRLVGGRRENGRPL